MITRKKTSLGVALLVAIVVSGTSVSLMSLNRNAGKLIFGLENPLHDLRRNIAGGDFSFRGVYGLTVNAPGTSANSSLVKKYSLRMIRGTSDSPGTDEQREFNDTAIDYAATYNRALLKFLKSREEGGSSSDMR